MGADAWVGLAALVVTVLGTAAGTAYQLGQLSGQVHELTRRVTRIEDKLDTRRRRELP